MDNFITKLMNISNSAYHLSNDEFCLFLRDLLVLFQVEGEIRSFTVL